MSGLFLSTDGTPGAVEAAGGRGELPLHNCTLSSCRTQSCCPIAALKGLPRSYTHTTQLTASTRPCPAVPLAGSSFLPHFLIRASLREKIYNKLNQMSTLTARDIFQ